MQNKEDKIIQFLDKNLKKDEKIRLAAYNENLQLVRFSDFSAIKQSELFSVAGKYGNISLLFIFGHKIPVTKPLLEKSILCFLDILEDFLDKYIIVFFLNGISSFEKRQASYLKSLFEKLPNKYYYNLDKIIIISANLLFKSDLSLSFSFISKFLKQKLIYLDNLSDLESQNFFKTEYYCKIPDFIFENSNKKLDSIQLYRKELSIEESKTIDKILIIGRNLEDFALHEIGIPYVLLALTGYFENIQGSLNTEGLFRISGAVSDEQKLEQYLEKQNYNAIFMTKNPIVIGGVLKQIFGKMPKPLFPYEIYEKIKNFGDIEENNRIEFIRNILQEMPELNRKVLHFLLKFFQKVIEHKEYNKMNSYNLAVCFSPCLLKPKEYGLSDLLTNTAIMVGALKLIIENYDSVLPEEAKTERQLILYKQKTKLLEEWEKAEIEKSNEISKSKIINLSGNLSYTNI